MAIAALYAVVRRGAVQPKARYALACVALGAMMAASLATWSWLQPSSALPDAAYRIRSAPPTPATVSVALPAAVRAAVPDMPPPFLPWVVITWLAGATAFWVRLAGGWALTARMRSTLVRPAPPEWQQIV